MGGLPLSDGVVTLREVRAGDAEVLVAGRDDEFHRWMGDGSPDPKPTAIIEVDGEVVGWVDHDHDDTRTWLAPDECNVGYHLFAPHRPVAQSRALTPEELMGYAVGWGVTWTCLGLGISAASYVSTGQVRSAAWGLIFVFLGIGSFINAALIRRQIAKQAAPPKP